MKSQPTVLRVVARIAVATVVTLLAISQVRPNAHEVAGTVAARLMQKADLGLPQGAHADFIWAIRQRDVRE